MIYILSLSFFTEYSEDRFRSEIAEPVSKQFPSMCLEYHSGDLLFGNHIEQWHNSDSMPDVCLIDTHSLYRLIDKQLCLNLLELNPRILSSHAFETGLTEHGLGNGGELFAVPYNNAMEYPLFYNKTIFDKFEIPYPSDGMTWTEVIELSAHVSGLRGEISYTGFNPADIALMKYQLSAELVSGISVEANVNSSEWRTMAQTIQQIYKIEGNFLPNRKKLFAFNRYFVKDKAVAMGIVCSTCYNPTELQFDWDIVSYPVFENQCGPNLWSNHMLLISPSCKKKMAALELIEYLVSDEFQINNCRKGILTSLNKKNVQMQFGNLVPIYENKNISSMFYNRTASPAPRNAIRRVIEHQLGMMRNGLDIGVLDYRRHFLEMVLGNKSVDETLHNFETDLRGSGL